MSSRLDVNSTTSLADGSKEGETPPDAHEGNKTLDDADRLRMLGYDAVLGRPLGLWGSTAMNLCHLFWGFEYIINIALYAYQAPLLFVSGQSLFTSRVSTYNRSLAIPSSLF
jgi:hypothetical protein